MDSWVHKLLLRDMSTKTKNKDQPTNNHKNNRALKNNIKIKAMQNLTPTMDQYSRNRWERPIFNLICHGNPVMSNLLPGFQFLLESIRNHP